MRASAWSSTRLLGATAASLCLLLAGSCGGVTEPGREDGAGGAGGLGGLGGGAGWGGSGGSNGGGAGGGGAGGGGAGGGSGGSGGTGTGNIFCDAAPTWAAFMEPLLVNRCLQCHSVRNVGIQRKGAPIDVNFDTEEEAIRHADRILVEMSAGRMPPGGIRSCVIDNLRAWIATLETPPG